LQPCPIFGHLPTEKVSPTRSERSGHGDGGNVKPVPEKVLINYGTFEQARLNSRFPARPPVPVRAVWRFLLALSIWCQPPLAPRPIVRSVLKRNCSPFPDRALI